MILIDAGPLVALFTPNDQGRKECARRLESVSSDQLFTTVPVLTEVLYFLQVRGGWPDRLRRLITSEHVKIHYSCDAELDRAFELQDRYADLPMDFADASIITAAEAIGTTKVFTLDQRDFTTYRIRRGYKHLPVEIV